MKDTEFDIFHGDTLLKNDLTFVEKVATTLTMTPYAPSLGIQSVREGDSGDRYDGYRVAEGPALRALYSLLRKVDPDNAWRGLSCVVTPDGNILYLCEEHRKKYEVELLKIL